MNAIRLFLRTRHFVTATLGILLVNGVGLALRTQVLPLASPDQIIILVPWVILLPVVPAIIVGAANRSELGHLERLAARGLRPWRAASLGVLLCVSAVATTIVALPLSSPFGLPAALRNLAGFAGLALLGGRFLSGYLGWTLPFSWAIAAVGGGRPGDQEFGWDWPIQPDGDTTAGIVAAVLFILGFAVGVTGTREP